MGFSISVMIELFFLIVNTRRFERRPTRCLRCFCISARQDG
jgi:hypothetical protein